MMVLLKDYLPLTVSRFYITIKNVENQIHGIHSKTKMSQIKGEQHLMDLDKTVNSWRGRERENYQ